MNHILILTDEQYKSIMLTTTLAIAEDISQRHWTVTTQQANQVMVTVDEMEVANEN